MFESCWFRKALNAPDCVLNRYQGRVPMRRPGYQAEKKPQPKHINNSNNNNNNKFCILSVCLNTSDQIHNNHKDKTIKNAPDSTEEGF